MQAVNPVISTLTPGPWPDYELIDSGGFEKLERFGQYVTARPEPQALWPKSLSQNEWDSLAHALFARDRADKADSEKGRWYLKDEMPDNWFISYKTRLLDLRFKLSLSSFKHVGLFPEQAANWDFIAEHLHARSSKASETGTPLPTAKVLNLFAYTGGASLAAKAAGADVVHVDSVKQVLSWARENMEASGQKDIRWMAEDALKYVRREVRRGSLYQGIILDPPAYGRGPEGEKWLLEEHLYEMLQCCRQLLHPTDGFFIINLYSLGFSALIVQNLINSVFGLRPNSEFGELYLPDSAGRNLPLGTYFRFTSYYEYRG